MTERDIVSSVFMHFQATYAGDAEIDYGNPSKFDPEADELGKYIWIIVDTFDGRPTRMGDDFFDVRILVHIFYRDQTNLYQDVEELLTVKPIFHKQTIEILDHEDSDSSVLGYLRCKEVQTTRETEDEGIPWQHLIMRVDAMAIKGDA